MTPSEIIKALETFGEALELLIPSMERMFARPLGPTYRARLRDFATALASIQVATSLESERIDRAVSGLCHAEVSPTASSSQGGTTR
jgi:hypothetical protein